MTNSAFPFRSLLLAALLSLPLLAFTASPAAAQFTGPGAEPSETSVQSILDDPQEDRPVVLRGRLLEQVDNEKYLFTDGSAQIQIEIDDEVLARHEISPQMEVEIHGQVEDDFLQAPEIDVERLTVVQAGGAGDGSRR